MRGYTNISAQHVAVTHGKLVIILYDHTSHNSMCCDLIGVEGIKVCLQPIRDCKVQDHSAPGYWKPMSAGIYFQDPPWENFD